MLRQKRMEGQKKSINKTLNFYSNENLQKITPKEYNCPAKNIPQLQTCRDIQNRINLRQISLNQNLSQYIPNNTLVYESKSRLISETKCFPINKDKCEDGFLDKIAKISKNQDIRIPASQLTRSKSFLIAKNRPYSCLSQRNRKAIDYSSFCKGQIGLQAKKKDQVALIKGPDKMSTSRALMVFSKISQNYSGQRFKVKKDRHLYHGPISLKTQRIILQQKQRRQNNFMDKTMQRSNSLSKPKEKQKQKNEGNNQYMAEQEFEIGGWEYFQ